jgi:3',5'-cyclic AMP phosphodiesterase CpdA
MQKHSASLIALIVIFALIGFGQTVQPPAKPPIKMDSLKFAVIGDNGTGSKEEYQIAEQMVRTHRQYPFGFVLMLGDNLYGSDSPKEFVKKFEKPYKGLLDMGIKFYAALGNHDDPVRQISYEHFNMGGKKYYTFKPRDGVRFFALDSNYMDKKQLDWLETELKNSGSEWKIVYFHHPIYSSGEKHGSNVELRSALEPVLVKYGVDVVLAGHEHFYERVKPQKGIHYFILGSSGKLRRGNIGKTELTAKGFDQDNAFMLADIEGDRMSFRVMTRSGKTVDAGNIQRAEKTRQVTAPR